MTLLLVLFKMFMRLRVESIQDMGTPFVCNQTTLVLYFYSSDSEKAGEEGNDTQRNIGPSDANGCIRTHGAAFFTKYGFAPLCMAQVYNFEVCVRLWGFCQTLH